LVVVGVDDLHPRVPVPQPRHRLEQRRVVVARERVLLLQAAARVVVASALARVQRQDDGHAAVGQLPRHHHLHRPFLYHRLNKCIDHTVINVNSLLDGFPGGLEEDVVVPAELSHEEE
ncbi:Os01g0216600, partial [Oryza sativa Japonica Group]